MPMKAVRPAAHNLVNISRASIEVNPGNHENDNGDDDQSAAQQTHLFGDCRIDIVRISDRDNFRKTEAKTAPRSFSRGNTKDRLRRLESKLVEPDVGINALSHRLALSGKLFQARIFRQRLVIVLLPPRFFRRWRIETVQPEMKSLLN